jgi:hypothetical protein
MGRSTGETPVPTPSKAKCRSLDSVALAISLGMTFVKIVGGLRRGVPRLYVEIFVEMVSAGSLESAVWGSFARRGGLRMTT